MFHRMLLCVAGSLALLSATSLAQQFRAATDLVVTEVSVLRPDGTPVRGLGAGDFVLYEDGAPQPIATFQFIGGQDRSGASTADRRRLASDVATNDAGDGKLVVILIDDATLLPDASMIRATRQIAHLIVDRLGLSDRAAVVFTRDNRQSQEFTTSTERLRAAIDRTSSGFLAGGRDTTDDLYYYQSSLRTGERVAAEMRVAPQHRKVLVYVSIGVPLDAEALTAATLASGAGSVTAREQQNALLNGLQRLLFEARRSGVNVYTVSPAGLGGLAAYKTARRAVQLPDVKLFRDYLETLAAQTGGRAFAETNDFIRAADVIERENGAYYLIGHRPASGRSGFRRIEVRVSMPGVDVRARNGYVAGEGRDAESVAVPNSVTGLVPAGNLALRAVALPTLGAGGVPTAVFTIAMTPDPNVSQSSAPLTFEAHAVDRNGRVVGGLRYASPGCRDTRAPWCERTSGFELKPGRYQLRIAVADAATDRRGSVFVDLDMPDFSRDALTLAGVMLSAAESWPSQVQSSIRASLAGTPTTRRVFAATDVVNAHYQLHQGGRRTLVPVTVRIRVADSTNATVVDVTNHAPAAAYANRKYVGQFAMPLKSLKPDTYRLEIAASAETGATRTSQVVFSVAER